MFKTLFSLIAISLVFAACEPNAAISTANAQTPDYEFTVIVPLDEFVVNHVMASVPFSKCSAHHVPLSVPMFQQVCSPTMFC